MWNDVYFVTEEKQKNDKITLYYAYYDLYIFLFSIIAILYVNLIFLHFLSEWPCPTPMEAALPQ